MDFLSDPLVELAKDSPTGLEAKAIVIGVVVLFVVIVIGGLVWRNHTLTAELAQAQLKTVELAAANDRAAQEAAQQNAAIEKLAAVAESRRAAAAQASHVVLARKIELPAGHGPEVLNAYFRAAR